MAEPEPDYLLKREDRFVWTEPIAQKALINCVDVHQNQTFPNVMLGAGEMDLAVLSRHGYLTEIEIKLTPQDWRNDRHKDKWLPKHAAARQDIKFFCYAVPVELLPAMPADINPGAGIISLSWEYRPRASKAWRVWGDWVRQPAAVPGARPISEDVRRTLLVSVYHRYWRQIHEMTVHDQRLLPLPEPELGPVVDS